MIFVKKENKGEKRGEKLNMETSFTESQNIILLVTIFFYVQYIFKKIVFMINANTTNVEIISTYIEAKFY